jgi:hypothetical protein
MDGAEETGGDPACWLALVCPACGRVRERVGGTACEYCGADLVDGVERAPLGPGGDGGQPTLDDIEARFVALAEGRLTRDEADRWAARWLADDDLAWDDTSAWALDILHGVDLPAGGDGGYLHGDAQVRAWLAELRERRAW